MDKLRKIFNDLKERLANVECGLRIAVDQMPDVIEALAITAVHSFLKDSGETVTIFYVEGEMIVHFPFRDCHCEMLAELDKQLTEGGE